MSSTKTNINIADILRDYPIGTRLYSPIFGDVKLLKECTEDDSSVVVALVNGDNDWWYFTTEGKYFEKGDAECCLFPSKEMRDWSKFFKRGDIVYNPSSQMYAIFEGWVDDTYTEFNTTLNLYPNHDIGEEEVCMTECFIKAEDTKDVISEFEKMFNGKYNPDTLHVEPAKPRHEFMPFDKVLVRDSGDEPWQPALFSWQLKNEEYCYGVAGGMSEPVFYCQCIPYNEKTAHLVGTSNPYEEK